MRVLEVGPGYYPMTGYIADQGNEYVGVGSFDDMFWLDVDRARNHREGVDFRVGSLGANLSALTNGELFDLVTMGNVLGDPRTLGTETFLCGYVAGSVSSLEELLEQVRTCLKPSGKLRIVEVLSPLRLDRVMSLVDSMGFRLGGILVEDSETDQFWQEYGRLYCSDPGNARDVFGQVARNNPGRSAFIADALAT